MLELWTCTHDYILPDRSKLKHSSSDFPCCGMDVPVLKEQDYSYSEIRIGRKDKCTIRIDRTTVTVQSE